MSKTVDDTYNIHWGKRYCMDLYRESLYTAVMKCNPSAKWLLTEVLDIVSREVSDLCFRKKLSTVLRKTGKDDLMDRLCVGYPSQIISLD